MDYEANIAAENQAERIRIAKLRFYVVECPKCHFDIRFKVHQIPLVCYTCGTGLKLKGPSSL